MNRLQMTGKVEEQIRIQIENKKALIEKLKKTGKESDELKRLDEDIAKLQELLREINEKSLHDKQPFEYPKRDR